MPIALYVGLVHQKAPGEVATFLRDELDAHAVAAGGGTPVVISQLMPCYAMPQYAALHPHGIRGARIEALGCSPSLVSARA